MMEREIKQDFFQFVILDIISIVGVISVMMLSTNIVSCLLLLAIGFLNVFGLCVVNCLELYVAQREDRSTIKILYCTVLGALLGTIALPGLGTVYGATMGFFFSSLVACCGEPLSNWFKRAKPSLEFSTTYENEWNISPALSLLGGLEPSLPSQQLITEPLSFRKTPIKKDEPEKSVNSSLIPTSI